MSECHCGKDGHALGSVNCPVHGDLDFEKLAGELYTAAHKGLKNCWRWEDGGLDHEHPQSRGYWRKVAKGLLAKHRVEPL